MSRPIAYPLKQKCLPFVLFLIALLLLGCGGGSTTNEPSQNVANNTPPVASDSAISLLMESVASATLTAHDSDDDDLTYRLVTQTSKGIVSLDNASTGEFTYTANPGELGDDSFTFQVSDGQLLSNTATLSISITALNLAPDNVSVSSESGQLTLSWDAVPGAASYTVYWSTSSGITTTNSQAVSGINGLSWAHTGLGDAVSYYYRVSASDHNLNESSLSAELTATTLAATSLSAPNSLVATPGDAEVSLNWSGVDGASSYTVYYASVAGVSPTNYSNLSGGGQKLAVIATSTTIVGLDNDTRYYFIVVANNTLGEGMPSNEGSAQPMRVDYLYMNGLRQQGGLNDYERNSQLELAALNHGNYLVVNEVTGHDETIAGQGFTGESPGDRAKLAGYEGFSRVGEVISYKSNAIDSLDGLMSAIYHRFGLMRNDVDEIGFALAQDNVGNVRSSFVGVNGNSKLSEICSGDNYMGINAYYSVCDPQIRVEASAYEAARDYQVYLNPELVVWPAESSSNVLPVFYEETPDPLPDYSVSGYPISAEFNDKKISSLVVSSFKLFREADDEEVTNTRLLNSSSDPNQKFSAYQVALFPLERLDYNTGYRAELSYVQDGVLMNKHWTFTTKDLGTTVYKINATADALTTPSGETFHVYVPPTQNDPRINSYQASYSPGLGFDAEFEDSNTLMITLTGDSGGRADFTLGNGGSFSVTIQ